EHLLRVGRARLELDAGVDVLGVLAEDHHVDVAGLLHRRGHALEPAHRAQADVQVEHLPQGHVERADAAADRRGQRALDAHQVVAAGLDGRLREPFAGLVEGLLAGQDFHPLELALAAIGLLDRGVEHAHAGAPDVGTGAIALDEGDDRAVGDVESLRGLGDRAAASGHGRGEVCHRVPPWDAAAPGARAAVWTAIVARRGGVGKGDRPATLTAHARAGESREGTKNAAPGGRAFAGLALSGPG